MNRYASDRDDRVVVEQYATQPRSRAGAWIAALVALAIVGVIAFFALGGDADVDEREGDVPAVDVDAPSVDVSVAPADADASTDG